MQKNIIIFASGNGTNFLNLIRKQSDFNYKIQLLFCDRKNAKVIQISKDYKIPFIYLSIIKEVKFKNKILKFLNKYNPDLIVLAGYMKKISESILAKWGNKIINIHPSLLPNFPGINAIERNIKSKLNTYGITIHYVNKDIDEGEIIFQKSFNYIGSDLEIISKKIKDLEHKYYPKIINSILNE